MNSVQPGRNKTDIRKIMLSSVCLMLTILFGFSQMFGWSRSANEEQSEVFKSDQSYFISGETTTHSGGTLVVQLFKDLADSDKTAEGEDDHVMPRACWNPAEIQKSAVDHVRWFQQNRILNNRKIHSLFILFQSWKGLL